jgi:hypothetical protein
LDGKSLLSLLQRIGLGATSKMLLAPFITASSFLAFAVASPHAPRHTSDQSSIPPLPSTGNSTLVPFDATSDFVTVRDGQVFLSGKPWKFATFNNPELILSDDYEVGFHKP